MDGTDVTEDLTGGAVCETDVGGNRTARTVVVSEEEEGGIYKTGVQTGVGFGGTGMREWASCS